MLPPAGAFHLEIEEIAEKRPDDCHDGEAADLIPIRRERCTHDVGRQLESETGHEPARIAKPYGAPLDAIDVMGERRPHAVEHCSSAPDRDDEDRNRLNRERYVSRNFMQQRFHRLSP